MTPSKERYQKKKKKESKKKNKVTKQRQIGTEQVFRLEPDIGAGIARHLGDGPVGGHRHQEAEELNPAGFVDRLALAFRQVDGR